MEVMWGFGKKRKYEDSYLDDDYDDEYLDRKPKRPRLFKQDKMIYRIHNEIHFCEGINNATMEIMIRKISKIIEKNHNKYKDYKEGDEKLKITYIVNSQGGSVTAVLRFVDFIKLVRKKYPFVEFTSIITGIVASAATIMCIVADKRHMTPNSTAMVHELSSFNGGKFTHMMSYSEFLINLHETLANIYLEKCKCTKEELEELLMKESWFLAQKYLELGFIDEII